MDSSKK